MPLPTPPVYDSLHHVGGRGALDARAGYWELELSRTDMVLKPARPWSRALHVGPWHARSFSTQVKVSDGTVSAERLNNGEERGSENAPSVPPSPIISSLMTVKLAMLHWLMSEVHETARGAGQRPGNISTDNTSCDLASCGLKRSSGPSGLVQDHADQTRPGSQWYWWYKHHLALVSSYKIIFHLLEFRFFQQFLSSLEVIRFAYFLFWELILEGQTRATRTTSCDRAHIV